MAPPEGDQPAAGSSSNQNPTLHPSPSGVLAASEGPKSNPSPTGTNNITVTSETVDVDGVTRSFVLATPSPYVASTAYPLILALHGDNDSGAGMQQALRFEDVSGQNAIVAYPTSSDGWDLYDPSDANPDAMFITTLINALRTRFRSINPERIFGIGISSGAFMVNQLACRSSSLFRGIVPHSGGAPEEPRDPNAATWGNGYVKCAGQTIGPAVMVLHGTADTLIPLNSGEYTADYWATVNGCALTRSAALLAPTCSSQDACPTNRPVLFCPIDNLGHQLWSAAAKTAWTFFNGL